MNLLKLNQDSLFSKLQAGALLVCPNNRLSQQLQEDYFRILAKPLLEKPLCLPYGSLLRHFFSKIQAAKPEHPYPTLLNSFQERLLWREVIALSLGGLVSNGLVAEVQEAWTGCRHWQLSFLEPEFNNNPQYKQFKTWQQHFKNKLLEINALCEADLVDLILAEAQLLSPTPLIWACFDDYQPIQRHLQEQLTHLGFQQYEYDLQLEHCDVQRFNAKDQQDEYSQMILWAESRLEQGDKRIAIVVPDLEKQAKGLQRIMLQHFTDKQFNISLGESLSDFPLIAEALHFLCLDKGQISNRDAIILLQSNCLQANQTEFLQRIEMVEKAKILQEMEFPFSSFIAEIKDNCPSLASKLSNLQSYPKTASIEIWIQLFKERLIYLGFPGEYPLNSASYQYLQRFLLALDEFMQIGFIYPELSQKNALTLLQEFCQSIIFQPKQSPCSIHILGLLEASGCSFDSLWFCGLSALCLPQKTKLSAFIPIELQRRLKMPHALAEKELILAKKLLHRLQAGSLQAIFSCPELIGDLPTLASPLIKNMVVRPPMESKHKKSIPLLQESESYIIPRKQDESIQGGTSLLANQAKCPFRSFANHRLHVRGGLAQSDGPNPMERGQIMHRVMEKIWSTLGSQAALREQDPESLEKLIHSIIQNCIAPYAKSRQYSFPPLIQAVEAKRLLELVHANLDWEMQRTDFNIEALEQDYTIDIAGLNFKIRVDRLDRVANKKWVIDYKSSMPSSKPWHEDRPEEPQLLLYALLDPQINALLFIQLKAGKISLSGFSEEVLTIKGINAIKTGEDWSSYQEQWKQKLILLAEEIKAGYCPPKPNRNSTCQNCDFPSLCRIAS